MLQLMKNGGPVMLFIVLFGLLALVAAILFARRPDDQRLQVARALSRATLFAVLSGIVSDLGMVCTRIPATPEWANDPQVHLLILSGIGESMAPGVIGFTLLSLVAFVCAVGLRRMPSATVVSSASR